MASTLTDSTRRVTATDTEAAPLGSTPARVPGAAEHATGVKGAKGVKAGASLAVGREADGLAVASFVLGLVGLLVFNLLLGPTAIVMAFLALARRTRRRGRAFLGLALGVADLVVLAVLITANGTAAWSLGG
ncbi:hypothetical protein CIB93_11385 [Streptomyces sp. WZ.A104]|uniref:hypothetical protein n=1 Tax=Streptomyces sp. WZ.A104 TaxID=2023771 RepID=UPI000BBC97B4|nr:hypothetical protein [Streptomyces sp. WZ.A104]PCG85902.1 hypothetical protein CIB93_11385 [Streptomyces sp. WZ.A104]